MNNQNTQGAAPQAQKTVVRDGNVIPALDMKRVEDILSKAPRFNDSHVGQLFKNLKVQGNGNYVAARVTESGKVAPAKYIYNLNAVSEIAYATPRAQDALNALVAANEAGDIEKEHDAAREFLNIVTLSFSTQKQNYVSGQLIQGMVSKVTTEKGSLLTLENTSAMQAVAAPTSQGRVDLKSLLSAPAAGAAPAPTGNAFSQAQQS